jgi:hypothetical protein
MHTYEYRYDMYVQYLAHAVFKTEFRYDMHTYEYRYDMHTYEYRYDMYVQYLAQAVFKTEFSQKVVTSSFGFVYIDTNTCICTYVCKDMHIYIYT